MAKKNLRKIHADYYRELTTEEKAVESCYWFHKWKYITSGRSYNYYQCNKCNKRKAEYLWNSGKYPIDDVWLNGGERRK